MLTPRQQAVIRGLAEAGLAPGGKPDEREAIRATGGVPVHSSWTGCTLVTPDGTVLHWDDERKSVETVVDKKGHRAALKFLAELDPELRSLAPVRPISARPCPTCRGKGTVEVAGVEADCGECGCVGWSD